MASTRRKFLSTGANAVAATAVVLHMPRLLRASGSVIPGSIPSADDPALKALVQRGLDAARAAGAVYADVRITHSYKRGDSSIGGPSENEFITAGVRALINGYWGFASGPVLESAELTRLGREASRQALANTAHKARPTILAPLSAVAQGTWTTPIEVDAYTLHPAHIRDIFEGLRIYGMRKPMVADIPWNWSAYIQDKTFGSSDGAFFSQRTYSTSGKVNVYLRDDRGQVEAFTAFADNAGAGFEIFDEQKIRDEIDRICERGANKLPPQPVDVGRFDTILSAQAVAQLLGGTIGAATESDRALGFEANAGGTSYLSDPSEMLNTYRLGAPGFTVTANRTERGGLATVRWDDEGVTPEPFVLIEDGVLKNYQTNREFASLLASMSGRNEREARSHGCAFAPQAVDAPLVHTANLGISPGAEDRSLDALIGGVERGVFFEDLTVSMDFQQLNGLGIGKCFEIRKGQKTALLSNAGILFKSTEIWKKIASLGGTGSLQRFGYKDGKGEPRQDAWISISTVPMVCKDQTIIDTKRKA